MADTMADTYDVIIIGGGPGGYVGAIRASQLGLRTAVVETEHLGGICLNWGCIPTKALLRSAEVYHLMTHAGDFGLKAKAVGFDLDAVVQRSRRISRQLNRGVAHLLKKNKITVHRAWGQLAGRDGQNWTVALAQEGQATSHIQAPHVVLATGAHARTLTLPGAEKKPPPNLWTYKEALLPTHMPKKLAVIGSGAIGIEFASVFATLGAEVTVLEIAPRILPAEDEEISALAQKQFQDQGMTILTNATITHAKVSKSSTALTVKAGEHTSTVNADTIIAAVGIEANTQNLNLENTKVRLLKGHIATDGFGQTGEAGLYAIGDVAGPPWLAHKAEHEAVVCLEHIAGQKPHPFSTDNIPGCTYSRPQIASVGLTEAQAQEQGYDLKVGKFPFLANGKAIALGEQEGLVKTIFDAKTGALLGAHMIGAEVTEMIQGYTLARTLETTEVELMHTIFPHPTLSEMMHESTLAAFGRAVHI